jgi:MFS family permease
MDPFFYLRWLYHEFGVASVWSTGRDAWLIILARSCRMFAYGTNSLILALFFAELQFTDYQIGLFMTLTLVGDVVLSLVLTFIADSVGRRKILVLGSILMISSGFIFAIFENFWILLFAAVVGVISATGGDFGPFRSIEESMLSQLTSSATRADVLSWYVTMSSVGSCIGTESSGRIVEWLLQGRSTVDAYHALFWIYGAMGLLNMGLMACLSQRCEAEKSVEQQQPTEESETLLENREPDDENESQSTPPAPAPSTKRRSPFLAFGSYLAEISKETRSIMSKLWFLLMVDSVADGMVPYSLTNYYLKLKFDTKISTLGDITSFSYFLGAISTIFAGPLSRHLGLLNTMVFTHIPSSAAVLIFPASNSLALTVILLFIRTGLNNMDQAPRAAFIAAVVKPSERTAVMGVTSMLRTLAATAGPTLTGIFAANDQFWIAFVAAGSLRLAYDFGLWYLFVKVKLDKHESAPPGATSEEDRRIPDEEEMKELQKSSKN